MNRYTSFIGPREKAVGGGLCLTLFGAFLAATRPGKKASDRERSRSLEAEHDGPSLRTGVTK